MKKLTLLFNILAMVACESTDPKFSAAEISQQLTSGPGKTARWIVTAAQMIPSTGAAPIDITDLANVKDDEFLFSSGSQSGEIKMEWRSRNAIRSCATTRQQALLDYYRSVTNAELTVGNDATITSDRADIRVTMKSDKTAQVRYQVNDSEITFDLTQEETGQGLESPQLNFESLTTISGKGLEQAAGFTGSMATQALYICYRKLDGTTAEKVLRLDLNTLATTSREFDHPDFVTKELHIINDELKVVGAQFVNTYPLDLNSEPVSVPHQLKLTRYGSTVVDEKVFLFGGDMSGLNDTDENPSTANRIYEHDQVSGELKQIGTLPESRFWAHGEMVDGKLYVFGGRTGFVTTEGQDDIFVWDSTTGSTETKKLPGKLTRTFAARYGHLILVAGQRENQGTTADDWSITTTFGYFNTQDETYHELPSNLAGSGKQTVYGFTLVADTLYVLYGSATSSEFTIYKATIN